MQTVLSRHEKHGVKSCIRGVVWEWQVDEHVSKLANVDGPEREATGKIHQDSLSKTDQHAEFDPKQITTPLPSQLKPAMEMDGQREESPREAPMRSNGGVREEQHPQGKKVLAAGTGLHPALRGGARQPGMLSGGSGQELAVTWQSTVEDISAALRQCAEDYMRMQPINIERHGFANLHQSEQWSRLTQLSRHVQSELLLFAQERSLSDGVQTDFGPPLKKPKHERYTSEQESGYRIQLCNLLDETREFQEDVLEALRNRGMAMEWSHSMGLMRSLRIMQARLESTEIFQDHRKTARELPEEDVPPRQHEEVPQTQMGMQMSDGRRHLLQQELANRGNLCYINSVLRTWAWTMQGLESQGNLGQMAGIFNLLTEGPLKLDIVQEEEFQLLAEEWPDMYQQHDAGDFLGFLMQQGQAECFTCKNVSIFENDPVMYAPIFLPFPLVQRPTNVQELIDRWSNHRAAIIAPEEVLVLRLGRYYQTGRAWLKHHGSVHWETPIMIPTGWQEMESTAYEVAAAIVHHGEDHSSGHYTAYFFQTGVNWHADDYRPAEKVMHVSAEEIYMLWLRRVREEELTTSQDTVMPVEESPMTLWLSSCNITMWSRNMADWLYHHEGELILLQEHHQVTEQMAEMEMQCVRKGWQPMLNAAEASPNGGSFGGIGILHKDHLSVHRHQAYLKEGCGWSAVVLEEKNDKTLLVTVYLKNSEGLQSRLNAELMGTLMACLQTWKGSWIVVGDWNVEPDQMAQSNTVKLLQGEIVAPEGATVNTGSLLDYAVASKELAPHLRAVVSWECPWKPHGELQILRDRTTELGSYPQLEHFPALPKPLVEFQTEWTAFLPVETYSFLHETLNDSGVRVAQWASRTEQFLLQNMPDGKEGRGRQIRIEHKPMQLRAKTGKWRRHHWTYWVRMQEAMEQKNVIKPRRWKRRFMELLQDVEKHWHHMGDGAMGQFYEMTTRWIQGIEEVDVGGIER